jgi:hypothetical protein
MLKLLGVVQRGLRDFHGRLETPDEVTKLDFRLTALERPAIEGDSPLVEKV